MRERIFAVLALLAILAFPFWVQPGAPASAQTSEWYREITFSSGNVITADETSAVAAELSPATLAAFQTVCTEDSGTASLDIAVQRSIDKGATWTSIVTMTQLTATGGETKLYADVRSASPQMIGDRLRINFDVTGTGQYTCSVYGALEG